MNNTAANAENKETLMTEQEMKDFVRDIVGYGDEPHVLDGFAFFFHTFSRLVETKQAYQVSDLCRHLLRDLYALTLDCQFSLDIYVEKVKDRYQSGDFYRAEDEKVYDKIKSEYLPIAENAAPDFDDFDDRERHYIKIWGKKLKYVLSSNEIPAEVRHSIQGILLSIANNTNTGVYDEPEVVESGFLFQMSKLTFKERRTYISCIDHVLTYALDAKFNDEINKFSVRYEDAIKEEPAPLDLSALSADELNTRDTKDNKHFAQCLSEILNSSNAPEALTDSIICGLNDLSNQNPNPLDLSPESIEKLLDLAGGAK